MDAFRIWADEAGRLLSHAMAGHDSSTLLAGGLLASVVVLAWWLSSRRHRRILRRLDELEGDVRALVMERERELLRQVKSQARP